MSDALSSVHDVPGVRRDAAGTVRNYGDPAAEYHAARSTAALIERSDRALLRMFGRDPVRMIQGLVTNDVTNAPAGRAVFAAVLTPKGKMLAEVRVIRRADDLLVECARDALGNLMDMLKRSVPPLFARFEDVTGAHALVGVYGPRAAAVVGGAFGGAALPADPAEDALAADGERIVVRTGYAGSGGLEVIVPAAAAAETWHALVAAGAKPAGQAALDVLRIEAGRPRWGAELTADTIPLEAGLLERAISTGKGCYTGQEVIIRILHRGHVNWHLRGILLGTSPAPAPGTQLLHPETGKVVGRITSACDSPVHRQTIALGYIRREVAPPAELRLERVDGAPVTVVALPFAPGDPAGSGDTAGSNGGADSRAAV
jgi:tRNA-modifying protein YgfZ